MDKYAYELKMIVRDYECDIQGIVNNANYQHYTEHTRHMFLRSRGISFADLHARGIDAVVAKMTMNFKAPLRGDDEFMSRVRIDKEGLRYVFYHDIFRLPEDKLIFRSRVDVVCLINGRLSDCEELNAEFAPFFSHKE